MTLLIDGDLLCFTCCYAVEEETHWDENIHTLTSDMRDAMRAIEQRLDVYRNITEDEGEIIICLSSYPTFRHEMYQEYKANRKTKRKPLCLPQVMNELEDRYTTVRYEGLEADDVLGVLATSKTIDDPIIVSIDKDMRTIPCKLLAGDDVELITRRQADRNWMIQSLTGDPTDNYKGISGVGAVTANKILGDTKDVTKMWEKVVENYKKQKLTYKEALTTARLARILRHEDYNMKTGKIKLWTP